MIANTNVNAILGTMINGQGSVKAVCGWCEAMLRAVVIAIRGLFLSPGLRYALELKLKPTAAILAPATCRTSCSTRRHSRHWRGRPGTRQDRMQGAQGVVVDPGTVGVV